MKVPQIPHYVPEQEIIRTEIKFLLRKGVIVGASIVSDDFVSTVFTKTKKSSIFILNDFVVYKYFNMESFLDVFRIIKKR